MGLREYAGAAKRTALSGDITAGAVTITVADATGYPTGASGPFAIAISLGVAAEEKVLISSRSGNTLTVDTRGYDGTSASAHSSGANVDHVLTAIDIREANFHVNDAGDPHPQYATAEEGFRAHLSANQAISAATFTAVVFNTEDRDDGGDYDPATGRWTVPATGWYDVAASCFFGVADQERTAIALHVNGASVVRGSDDMSGAAGSICRAVSTPMYLTAGDYVQVFAYRQIAGNVTATSAATYFTAKRRYTP